jgi:ketosteroid isomerase-like protein
MEVPSAKWFAEVADTYNSGDMQAFVARFAPEVVFEPDPRWPESGPFVGRTAFARFLEEWSGAWEEPRLEVNRVEQRNDATIAECRWIVSGAASGAAVPTAFTVVARFGPDGQATRIAAFLDHAEALRSAASGSR